MSRPPIMGKQPPLAMTTARRDREIARPRQIAMYLCREHTPRSLPQIGRAFGGRDHTTVMHACRQIERLRAEDGELDCAIRALTAEITTTTRRQGMPQPEGA